jgi:hypothetical protein
VLVAEQDVSSSVTFVSLSLVSFHHYNKFRPSRTWKEPFSGSPGQLPGLPSCSTAPSKSPFSLNVTILAIYSHRRFTYTMPLHKPPSSASFLLSHLVYKSTRPVSALRRTRVWRTLISRNGTCDTSRRHTSHHDSFYRTRDQTSLLSQGISPYSQRDGSRLGPTTEYPIPGRRSTRAPIRTDGPSRDFSWHRLWKHRPRTDTTKHSPTPLNSTKPKSV